MLISRLYVLNKTYATHPGGQEYNICLNLC